MMSRFPQIVLFSILSFVIVVERYIDSYNIHLSEFIYFFRKPIRLHLIVSCFFFKSDIFIYYAFCHVP